MSTRTGQARPGETNYIVLKDGSTIAFDVVESLTHSRNADTTDNEVEDSTVISDHYVRQPKTLPIEAIISDWPISAVGQYDPDADGWHTKVFDLLEKMWKNGDQCAIVTHQATYISMVLTSFSAPVTPDNSRALRLSLNFKEIRKARTDVSEIAPAETAVGKLMKGFVKTAFKAAKEATTKQAAALTAKLTAPQGASNSLTNWFVPR
jgi:hypothetical protein